MAVIVVHAGERAERDAVGELMDEHACVGDAERRAPSPEAAPHQIHEEREGRRAGDEEQRDPAEIVCRLGRERDHHGRRRRERRDDPRRPEPARVGKEPEREPDDDGPERREERDQHRTRPAARRAEPRIRAPGRGTGPPR